MYTRPWSGPFAAARRYIRQRHGSAARRIYSVKHFVFRGADRTEGSFGAACHSTSTKVRDDTFVALRAATR